MSEMGFPITALTLPEPSTKLTKWRADFRKRWNIDTIVIGDGSFSVLDVVRAIQKKRFVALLIDRPFDQHAIEVTMPNGKVLFSTGPALIALLAKCPIVPVGVLREHDGKFKIIASDFIEPKWLPEGREATLDYYTREIAKSLIPLFASDPEQWFHFAPLGSSPSTS
jgi:predicted LPLAT superfamily acyltransferase